MQGKTISRETFAKFRRPQFVLLMVFTMASVLLHSTTTAAQKYSDWLAPVNLGSTINSTASDQQPAISKNGLRLYFASNRAGGYGGFDIYVSQRANAEDAWGAAINLGAVVNTPLDEGNPAFSRDEHSMFFQSKRPGGLGGIDLWVSQREHTHDDFDWQPAVNLGTAVNSAADDNGPSFFANDDGAGPQLFFASARPGLGGADLYVSDQMPDGSFAALIPLAALNSPVNESDPSIRHDGLEIFFQSNRTGSLGQDLWVATRDSTFNAWSTPVNLGSPINTTFGEQNAYLSSDNLTLFFASDRPGGSGGVDLYVATRTRLRGTQQNETEVGFKKLNLSRRTVTVTHGGKS